MVDIGQTQLEAFAASSTAYVFAASNAGAGSDALAYYVPASVPLVRPFDLDASFRIATTAAGFVLFGRSAADRPALQVLGTTAMPTSAVIELPNSGALVSAALASSATGVRLFTSGNLGAGDTRQKLFTLELDPAGNIIEPISELGVVRWQAASDAPAGAVRPGGYIIAMPLDDNGRRVVRLIQICT